MDIRKCAELISNAMKQQPIDKNVLEQTLKAPNVIILVAKVKERVVGLITGLVFPFAIPPPRIDFLAVPDEESAQKGLYGLLVDKFIEKIKKRLPNARYVDTNIATENQNFVAMYSLKGFKVIGFIKGEKQFNDVVVLRKNISKEQESSFTV